MDGGCLSPSMQHTRFDEGDGSELRLKQLSRFAFVGSAGQPQGLAGALRAKRLERTSVGLRFRFVEPAESALESVSRRLPLLGIDR